MMDNVISLSAVRYGEVYWMHRAVGQAQALTGVQMAMSLQIL